MSYYGMTDDMYRSPPPATPGWQLAPVPGWGANPLRSGPPIIATHGLGACGPTCDCKKCGLSGEGDKYRTMTEGHVAIGAASGMLVGWFLSYVYFKTNKRK